MQISVKDGTVKARVEEIICQEKSEDDSHTINENETDNITEKKKMRI